MTRFIGHLCIGLFIALFSCNTKNVPSKTPKKMVLASDFLERKDSILFKDFKSKTGIQIVVIPMTIDSILKHQQVNGFNSKIDMVLLKSLQGIHQLSEKEFLHPFEAYDEVQTKEYKSNKNDWVAIGLDPYVISGVPENQSFQCNELTYGEKWLKQLNHEDMAAFQAAVLFQFGRHNRVKSLKWLEKLESQSTFKNDSLTKATYQLTKLSDAISGKKTYTFPNQSKKFGAFYDAIAFGVILHGSNAFYAQQFGSYYLNLVHNQVLCSKINVLPTTNPNGNSSFAYQNKYPILFRCSPNLTVAQFRDIHRLQSRLEQDTKKPRLENEAI